jgi:hypothetical protein
MSRHRFPELVGEGSPVAVADFPSGNGFMPCPCELLRGMTPERQAMVEQLYRLALEQAQAQVRSSRLKRLSYVSVN